MQKAIPGWQNATEVQWREACRREAVIRPLAEQEKVSRAAAIAAADELGMSRAMVYRLVASFRRRPQTSSLVPGVRGRAASSRSLDPRVEVLVASAIKEVYLRPERPRLIDLWRAVRAQCALVLPRGNAADSRHLVAMVKEQITNTGVIPAMTSADDGYSSQEGREEVLGLGVKVVSISGAKGKRLLEAQQWKSRPYRQARAERSAIESLVFTLKEDFEFGEMARRSQENVLAEMLEKVLAYNISQIIRARKRLLELEQMERAAA